MNITLNKKQTDYKTVLFAVLAGAGAGLAVGMLMAPKSGDETRAEIGAAVDGYLDSARQTAENLKTSATTLAQRGIREVQKTKDMVADQVREAVNTGEQEAHSAINQTVAAVDAGAKKSHDAIHQAASAVRSGARG